MRVEKVCIVTGTRAEYGILKPLINKVYNDPDLELQLVVTGMHLLKKFGYTIEEIKQDGFPITAKVPMYDDGLFGHKTYHGYGLGKGIKEFTKVFLEIKPDIVVVLGDRLEPLAATLAAATLNLPIAHIHAGDYTDSGHIDDQTRFAVSRFAHLLFAPTKKSAYRLIKMGEQPWRVHIVGALGLDTVLSTKPIPKKDLSKKLNINPNEPFVIVLFHPVIHEYETIGNQMNEILEAIKHVGIQSVIIYPNNDAGSEKIIEVIEKFQPSNQNVVKIKNIEHNEYISLMHYASLMIGNSSSGIIEAPSLGLPFVHVGTRNRGREHADNVIFTEPNRKLIIKAIKKALYDKKFLSKVKMKKNPYGDGKTSDRIIKILKNIKINDIFLRKRLTL